jgi:phage terminase small subunit
VKNAGLKGNQRMRGIVKKREIQQRRKRFAEIFLTLREKGIGDTQAVRQAAMGVGYTKGSAQSMGSKMLNDPFVRRIIEGAVARHMERAEVNGETIMKYWWDIATCELPFPPAGPCRYCWGEDHQYQYTLAEYRNAQRKHTSDQLKKSPHLRVPFDELGGIGFDRTKKPHPYCTECNGEGRNYMLVIDREKLTPAQRQAIDEVRVHKDGSVSLKMRDRSRAMENLQQLMGMIQPRKPLEVIDPQRPIEENVDILLQTAIDQGLINMQPPSVPTPVLEHDGPSEQLADADAA